MDAISQDEAVEASANQETEERTGLVTREQETERKKKRRRQGREIKQIQFSNKKFSRNVQDCCVIPSGMKSSSRRPAGLTKFWPTATDD